MLGSDSPMLVTDGPMGGLMQGSDGPMSDGHGWSDPLARGYFQELQCGLAVLEIEGIFIDSHASRIRNK
jgi:hypothetical protein